MTSRQKYINRKFSNIHIVRCRTSKYGAYKCSLYRKNRRIGFGPIYVDVLDFPNKYVLKPIELTYQGIHLSKKRKLALKEHRESRFEQPLSCIVSKSDKDRILTTLQCKEKR